MTMSAVLAKQLTFLLTERRRRYRPLVWRSFTPIRTGIPRWANTVEVIRLKEYGNEPVPIEMGTNKAPVPTLDRDSGTLPVFEYMLAYQIMQSDLERAAVTGVNVTATKTLSNQRSAEEFLDKIAAFGMTKKVSAGAGLLRSSDVAVLQEGSDNASGGVNFPVHAFDDDHTDDEIFDTVDSMLFKIEDQSHQAHTANVVILPDTKYRYLVKRKGSNSDRSLLSIIQESYPGVRFVPWYRARAAGGTFSQSTLSGDATRAMAFDASADVCEMLMVNELQDGEPLKIHGGYEVLQTLKTGGVAFWSPKGAVYADGI